MSTISFRLIVCVEDDSGCTSLTLLNMEAEQLISVLVDKIITELSEVISSYLPLQQQYQLHYDLNYM